MNRAFPRIVGYTLVEVMVALLVFSIGILAAAGMISSAHFNNRYSHEYGIAVHHLHQMGERIRANPVGLADGNYNNITNASKPGNAINCGGGCTPANIAANDIFEWYTSLENELPDGDGEIILQNNRLLMTVMWNSDRSDGASSCTSNPPLQCISVEVQ